MDTDIIFPITPCSTPSPHSNSNSNSAIANPAAPKAKNRDPILDQLKQIRQIIEPMSAAIPILKRELAALSTQFNNFARTMDTALNPENCILCNDAHESTTCPNYSNSASRIARIVELGKCVQCLETQGASHGCQRSCDQCQQAHNTLLCWKQDLRPKEEKQPQQTQDKEGGPKSGGHGPLKTRYRRSRPTPSRPYFPRKWSERRKISDLT